MPATPTRPRLLIIGGGFAGLTLARALKSAPLDITLVDRRNHHLFQPLLYQVATASLSPADIAWPIRKVLSRQQNVNVLLGEAVRIDAARRVVVLADGELPYDILALCAGVSHSYFGHEEWAPLAPGLKSIEDAVEIRRRFLLAFEAAERETDPAARAARLTFIVVGGGPTGVELAGAMIEIARNAMPRDFRSIDTTSARIVLVEGGDRLLGAYPPDLSARAKRDLEQLGVQVILGRQVTHIDTRGVLIGEQRIEARNVLWAAGVTASPLAATIGNPTDRAGRLCVNPDLTLEGHPEIFVLGDLAVVIDPKTSKPVPGIAPAAMQMARHAAKIIRLRLARATGSPAALSGQPVLSGNTVRSPKNHETPLGPPFLYHDKGTLATIGRARAVGVIGSLHIRGLLAWLLWAGIHISFLITARSRLLVLMQWIWEYLFFQRGARIITGDTDLHLRDDQPPHA